MATGFIVYLCGKNAWSVTKTKRFRFWGIQKTSREWWCMWICRQYINTCHMACYWSDNYLISLYANSTLYMSPTMQVLLNYISSELFVWFHLSSKLILFFKFLMNFLTIAFWVFSEFFWILPYNFFLFY